MNLRTSPNVAADLAARAEAAHARHVDLQFTDVVGGVKTVTIPAGQLQDAVEHGTWFDGSSVESFARTAESDMYLVPDPDTFQLLPWAAEPTARLICWACTPDGEPYPGDPRRAPPGDRRCRGAGIRLPRRTRDRVLPAGTPRRWERHRPRRRPQLVLRRVDRSQRRPPPGNGQRAAGARH